MLIAARNRMHRSLLGVLCALSSHLSHAAAVHSVGNPILADGSYYSADPAPFVFDGKLWILAGRDEAPPDVNDFIMREWQLLSSAEPHLGKWVHYPAVARPEAIFDWAEPQRAYAAQIVAAANGKLYMYAPVLEARSDAPDRFAMGVAVADSPLGPWRDAHPSGPILSQRTPLPNTIQNIDPTVLVDTDGRVYIYWGTFGQLRGMELERDMVTPKGAIVSIDSLPGFFEAPWLMKRNGVYYLLYAGNNTGQHSPCTPTLYHACIAYGTASSPLGPWTYHGIVLKPVSSTTSHVGTVELDGRWYLTYHTADGKDGGHFRRSVAIDVLEWDDSAQPPAIKTVIPTRAPQPKPAPSRNVALWATAAASNEPIPHRYWIKALDDGKVRKHPLPPELWSNWTKQNPAREWLEYRWSQPVTVNATRVWFWADQPLGSSIGVAPPQRWHLEYWKDGWRKVPGADRYGVEAHQPQEIRFDTITTRCLRMVLEASGSEGAYAGLALQEWEILAPNAQAAPATITSASPCDNK
jgi:hypothetical protein